MSRFYGGDPWRWLKDIPQSVVFACAEMMPRLRAQESLTAVRRTAVGTGSLDRRALDAAIRDWQRETDPDASAAAARPTHDQLRHVGVGVRVVQPR